MARQQIRNPVAKPGLLDRIKLALSTGRYVDGVWVGSWSEETDVRRIEDALLLIKRHSPVHYSRIVGELARIWVIVLFHRGGQYRESLQACLLDERYVVAATSEQIASTIVHEATHARIARCGIRYEEKLRSRIEAVCRRRELAFAAKLPNGAELQEKVRHALEWYEANPEWHSNERFRERRKQGAADGLRYLETPEWLIAIALKLEAAISRLRRLLRSTR
jgi:hypothetical protein